MRKSSSKSSKKPDGGSVYSKRKESLPVLKPVKVLDLHWKEQYLVAELVVDCFDKLFTLISPKEKSIPASSVPLTLQLFEDPSLNEDISSFISKYFQQSSKPSLSKGCFIFNTISAFLQEKYSFDLYFETYFSKQTSPLEPRTLSKYVDKFMWNLVKHE